ncbi:hypothetical protein TcasGA2_TC010733, partial [Tribolium castaneum]
PEVNDHRELPCASQPPVMPLSGYRKGNQSRTSWRQETRRDRWEPLMDADFYTFTRIRTKTDGRKWRMDGAQERRLIGPEGGELTPNCGRIRATPWCLASVEFQLTGLSNACFNLAGKWMSKFNPYPA